MPKKRRDPFSATRTESGDQVLSISELKRQSRVTREIPLEEISDPSWHDRSIYNESAIEELAQNILEVNNGKLLHPIIVREMEQGGYQRIAGFRRVEAYKILGRRMIPAMVLPKNLTEEQSIKIMLSENIERENVNPYDQTKSLVEYIRVTMGSSTTTQEAIAELYRIRNYASGNIKESEGIKDQKERFEEITRKIGKMSLASLISRLEVYKMDESITEALRSGEITFSAAHLLHKIKDKDQLKEVLEAAKSGLTTKELQERMYPQRERVRVKGRKITLGVSLSKIQGERLERELERILKEILEEPHDS